MVEIRIGTNEHGQRLDRFLRKYLQGAPLSLIYKVIRKDAKVNGKRKSNVYMLECDDVVTLYLDQNQVDEFHLRRGFDRGDLKKPKRTFRIAYEDDEVLIADKPAGLLTHGDKFEKSKHLTNQVQDYLIEKGEYDPRAEKTFSPSPVNRIDRNTSGLVIFAKDYETLKRFNEYLRERDKIRKYYLTIVCGRIESELKLSGMIVKDESRNISGMAEADVSYDSAGAASGGSQKNASGRVCGGIADSQAKTKTAVTYVKPIACGEIKGINGTEFTLAEVEIETGRTHQIRVQLADAGYPLAGDPKYGDPGINRKLHEKYGLTHQLLTAERLEFGDMGDEYPALTGKTVKAQLPKIFQKTVNSLTSR